MTILLYFLLTLHVITCVLMVLVVLMQRPRNEGLGAAFGGGMTENIFGAQTTHVLAKFTTWLGGAFFILTLALAMLYSHLYNDKSIQRQLMSMPEPQPAAAAPAPVGEPLPDAVPDAVPAAEAPAVEAGAAETPAAATPAAAQPVAPLAPATPAAPAPEPATP